MADTDIEIAIAANALGPKQVTADGVTVQQHSLADQTRLRRGYGGQVAADKHLASKRATADPRKAFCRVKIVPPGAV